MATKLDKSVIRDTGLVFGGRNLNAGLEFRNDKPALTLRLKGNRTGWFVSLEDIFLFAVAHVERTNQDVEVVVSKDRVKFDEAKKKLEADDT